MSNERDKSIINTAKLWGLKLRPNESIKSLSERTFKKIIDHGKKCQKENGYLEPKDKI